jgi:hypothetical protein
MNRHTYYLFINGRQTGPLAIDNLREYDITAETKIWRDDLENWVCAKDLPEILPLYSTRETTISAKVNGFIVVNQIIQLLILLSVFALFEGRDHIVVTVFVLWLLVSFLLSVVSLVCLFSGSHGTAKVLMIISSIPYLPIGILGIIGVIRAIDKTTYDSTHY